MSQHKSLSALPFVLLIRLFALALPGASARAAEPMGLARAAPRERAAVSDSVSEPLDDDELTCQGATIEHIVIHADEIFDIDDPAENRKVFRLANHLHRSTRAAVIRRQLLFHVGEPYDPRLLEESERLLRTNRYLYDVRIRRTRCRDHEVEIEVTTRDVWTLDGGFSFGRKGGTNSTRFKLQDTNFLGTGKDLRFEQRSNVDRTSTLVGYRDPNLVGGHGILDAFYVDSSDGSDLALHLARPFYALDSRWAVDGTVESLQRVERRYQRGEVVDRYRHDQDFAELSGGWSRGLRDGHVRRWTFGATYQRDAFSSDGDFLPAVLPEDRRLVYPWVGFEYVEDAFAELTDFDKIHRTEDRYVGLHYVARLGFASRALGSDSDQLIFDNTLDKSWRLGDGELFELAATGRGRFGEGHLTDIHVGALAQYYRRVWGRHLFFVRLSGDRISEPDLGENLLLGGDSGLRGYPLRYQMGDRRVLLTLEQRFYSDWHLFHLVRVGAAAFFDVGRAWYADPSRQLQEPGSGWLEDIGMGLRLSSSRTARGNVIHLDAAFPLDGDGSIDGVQWLVSTRESF